MRRAGTRNEALELVERIAATGIGFPEAREAYAEAQARGLTKEVATEVRRQAEAQLREADCLIARPPRIVARAKGQA